MRNRKRTESCRCSGSDATRPSAISVVPTSDSGNGSQSTSQTWTCVQNRPKAAAASGQAQPRAKTETEPRSVASTTASTSNGAGSHQGGIVGSKKNSPVPRPKARPIDSSGKPRAGVERCRAVDLDHRFRPTDPRRGGVAHKKAQEREQEFLRAFAPSRETFLTRRGAHEPRSLTRNGAKARRTWHVVGCSQGARTRRRK